MQLNIDELVYLRTVLERDTIAEAESIDLPTVKHQKLFQKIDDEIYKRQG